MRIRMIFALVLLVPSMVLCNEISEYDVATYSLSGKDGKPSGMQLRLDKSNGKWIVYGKKKESTDPWKNISCDAGCDYRASTMAESMLYLNVFPGEMPKKYEIACIQNMANAFCRLTMKSNPQKGGYALVALVTGKPVPITLQRLDGPR